MLKIIVNGAAGRMGHQLRDFIASEANEFSLAYAADRKANSSEFGALGDFAGEADCIIDFSNHLATAELVEYAVSRKLPLVVATTGQTPSELALLHQAAKSIPVFFAANMSLGIATLLKLVKQATQLFPDADIEIVEQHHNQKLDIPSGTALSIAKAIQSVRPQSKIVVGRSDYGQRAPEEIGVHSLRLGNVVGIHEIILSNGTETLSLRHEAHSRSVFALGALHAAKFVASQTPGLFEMADLLKGL